MARSEWRETARVKAAGTDGRIYTVVATVRINHPRTMDSRTLDLEDRGELMTADGHPVHYVSKGHYILRGTDIELRSNDPNAP